MKLKQMGTTGEEEGDEREKEGSFELGNAIPYASEKLSL